MLRTSPAGSYQKDFPFGGVMMNGETISKLVVFVHVFAASPGHLSYHVSWWPAVRFLSFLVAF